MRTRSWRFVSGCSGLVVSALALSLLAGGPAGASTASDMDAGLPVWGVSTSRVSLTNADGQSSGKSFCCPQISAHGRYVAFESLASDLVPGDTNGQPDVFLRDRLTGTTTRLSVASDGTEANGLSSAPSLSNDGLTVAFFSEADNLVRGDTNGVPDIFVRNVLTGKTTRVSVSGSGEQANARSEDPVISGDGRSVSFISDATNLVPGDTNEFVDVFVRDLSGGTERVSVAGDGSQGDERSFGPAISRTGRFVAFDSAATNLVPGDTNDEFDIFLYDRSAGTTERVSVSSDGEQGQGGGENDIGFPETVSADGRYVTFDSNQGNLVARDTNENFDVFVRDRERGRTHLVSRGADGAQIQGLTFLASASDNARHILLYSYDDRVVPGDENGLEDLFLRDRKTGTVEIVSVSNNDSAVTDSIGGGYLSRDGDHVAFWYDGSDLVGGDTNNRSDIFTRDQATGLR